MSWDYRPNWSDHDFADEGFDPVGEATCSLARKLAKAAGEDWDRMNIHPGIRREHWREMARKLAA